MTDGETKKGCPGAVDDTGNPSRSYCTNQDGRFPWWQVCCSWNWDEKKCVDKRSYVKQTASEVLHDGSEYFLINSPGYPRTYGIPKASDYSVLWNTIFPIEQDENGNYDKSVFPLISPEYTADNVKSYNYKIWEISLPEDHEIGLTMLECDLDPM